MRGAIGIDSRESIYMLCIALLAFHLRNTDTLSLGHLASYLRFPLAWQATLLQDLPSTEEDFRHRIGQRRQR